jgi:hypothetical protein
MGYEKCIERFWSKNLTGREHLEGKGVNGRIKLEWVLKK